MLCRLLRVPGEADTICRNRTAFDPWLFRPRILRDVSEIGALMGAGGLKKMAESKRGSRHIQTVRFHFLMSP